MSVDRHGGSRGHLARGTNLWLQQLRLFSRAVRIVVIVGLAVGAASGAVYFWCCTTRDARTGAWMYALATFRLATAHHDIPITFTHAGDTVTLLPHQIASVFQPIMVLVRVTATRAFYIGLLVGAGTSLGVGSIGWRHGRNLLLSMALRGAQLVDGPTLTALLKSRQDDSPHTIADVPMRRHSENLNTIILGAQGTGKSAAIFACLRQLRARGMRAIVYDPSEEFLTAFFREGQDTVMNPLDQRSPNWNVWNEIAKDFHYDNVAKSFIPEPVAGDPFWALAGRMIVQNVLRELSRLGQCTNRALYKAVSLNSLDEMYKLLKGTAGAAYVDPGAERTALSLKMTVQNQLDSLRFLHDDGSPFSIRKWVKGDDDSWLFITGREAQREPMLPILSLWIDTAIMAVLDLPAIHRERLWIAIDELPTLQRLSSLPLAVTNTRKYGGCFVLSAQDIPQIQNTYGDKLARTVVSGCQTKLLMRVTDGDAAKMMTKLIAESETDEIQETQSYGTNSHRDGANLSPKRTVQDLVLTSEIMRLPDMAGYLVLPGDYPVARVSFTRLPMPKIAPGFIERSGWNVAHGGFGGLSGTAAAFDSTKKPGAGRDTKSPLFDVL